jgi:hypothetical protein
VASRPRKHLVIPDLQVKPGVRTDHLDWIARFAVEKKPDVILQGGDWADMSSLSSYDVGTKAFEGRRIKADLDVTNETIKRFTAPIKAEMARLERRKQRAWVPELEFIEGNHEHRILRAINLDPKIEGLIHPADLKFKEEGWRVTPFLQVRVIDGVAYSHYFASGQMGRPITTARALLNKQHMSCFAFHQQGRDIAYAKRADGRKMTAIICGSCYLHDEDYLNAQTNQHWRGVYMLHEVEDGSFDEMPVSLRFLEERYG